MAPPSVIGSDPQPVTDTAYPIVIALFPFIFMAFFDGAILKLMIDYDTIPAIRPQFFLIANTPANHGGP